jgi:transcriptional regulator with XRE-family HTH domain
MIHINTGYLTAVRKNAGFNQRDFAQHCNTSYSHYSKIEGGFVGLSIELLIRMDDVLDNSLDFNRLLKQKRPLAESPASSRGELI